MVNPANERNRNRAAIAFMLAAVIGYSLIPLAIALSGGEENPFYFNAAMNVGICVGLTAFLATAYRSQVRNKEVLKLVRRRAYSLPFALVAVNNFGYAMFALSARFIDISVTAILYEVSPIFVILLTAWLFRKEKRFNKLNQATLGLTLLAFFGVGFVIASQTGGFGDLDNLSPLPLAFGALLAMVAAIFASFSAIGLKWGIDLSKEIPADAARDKSDSLMELFCVVVAGVIANCVAIPLSALAGLVNGETLSRDIWAIGLAAGVFANAAPTIFWRMSNLLTTDLGVYAIGYLAPVFALAWLFAFSLVEAQTDFLIIGAAGIIAANLLINFEAEIRFGFKSLIIALWACGAVVYLRPVDGALFGVENWEWAGTEYFAALALSATIFTLILSFRIARLVSRTAEEENRSFAIFQKLDSLVRRGAVSGEARRHILRIDVSEQKPESLKKAYDDAMRLIHEAESEIENESDRERLGEVEAELNALVHSKQRGIVFGELFALYVFAGITVALALFSRPEIAGWTGFLVETLAALFSAVIVFLIFNALDLQRERLGAILKKANGGGYRVAFGDARSRVFEQRVSVVVGLALSATYAGLLWEKWIG